MRILYITQTLPPEPGATHRPLKQAVWLQKLGHSVTILATMPYYPHGRVFDGYRGRLIMRQEMEGVQVVRVWSVPATNRGVLRRLVSYGSFAVNAAVVGVSLGRHDLVVASVPNPFTELAGLVIGRLTRSKVLVEMRDLFPDNLVTVGIPWNCLLSRALYAYFGQIYRWADLVAVPGRNMVTALRRRGVPARRILLLPHAADPEQLGAGQGARVRRKYELEDSFVAVYAGSFSSHYMVPELVEAAARLEKRLPRFHLLLVGTGPDAAVVAQAVRDKRLRNVTLTGAVAPNQVCHYLQAADLFLAPCGQQCECYDDYLVTKACEYLMVGRPVLAIESRPTMGNIIRRIGAGQTVPPHRPDRLAEAIAFFATHPDAAARCGGNARRFARAHLSRQRVVGDFEAALCRRLAECGTGAAN